MWKCSSFDNICQARNKEGIALCKFFINLLELVHTKKTKIHKKELHRGGSDFKMS